MKKIYFHIGVGKTGTTSLQAYLNDNYEILLDNGVIYPRTGIFEGSCAHHLLADLEEEYFSYQSQWLYESLVREILSVAANTVIICSENFSYVKPSFVDDIFNCLHEFDIYIVFYVREQVSYILSSYMQWFKMSRLVVSPYTFYKTNIDSFDFEKIINPWEAHVDANKIFCRLYDRRNFCDVIDDFTGLLRLPRLEVGNVDDNPSINPVFINLMLAINNSSMDDVCCKNIIDEISFISSNNICNKIQYENIDASLTDEIRNEYYSSNKRFAERYLTQFEREIFMGSLGSRVAEVFQKNQLPAKNSRSAKRPGRAFLQKGKTGRGGKKSGQARTAEGGRAA